MQACDKCKDEVEILFDIYKPDYSTVLFRLCLICNNNYFLCPICLTLRDRYEEYVNGRCIYETNYMKDILNRLSALEEKLEG